LHARVVDEEEYAELALRLRCSEAVARKRVSRAVAHARTVIGGTDG
jgi:RNA polymerase sigma-70 factor (ECF subfamily)